MIRLAFGLLMLAVSTIVLASFWLAARAAEVAATLEGLPR